MNDTQIEYLKQSIDCREMVERDTRQAPLNRGKRWIFYCPFHNERTPGGFHVWEDGYKCFSCGAAGDVIGWRMAYFDEPFVDAVTALNGGELQPLDPAKAARIAAEQAQRAADRLQSEIQKAQAALDELRRTQSWLEYYGNLSESESARQLWRDRGVPDAYQDIWQLGYDDNLRLWKNDVGRWVSWWQTPTMTIPLWGLGWQVNNVKHRLLNVPENGGKYRQEKSGIPPAPFIADPDITSGPLLLVEGEIKSMVSYITADNPSLQVAGLPSKTPAPEMFNEFDNYDPVYLCLDPDAYDPPGEDQPTAVKKAILALGRERVRVMWMPNKIDDTINAGQLDKAGMRRLMNSARVV